MKVCELRDDLSRRFAHKLRCDQRMCTSTIWFISALRNRSASSIDHLHHAAAALPQWTRRMGSLPLRRSRTVRSDNNSNNSNINSSTITSSTTTDSTARAMSTATRERPRTARRAPAASRAAHDTSHSHGRHLPLCAYIQGRAHTDTATQ
jgi:hypothetical protein